MEPFCYYFVLFLFFIFPKKIFDLWTKKLNPTVYQHRAEKIMPVFSFLVNLFFNVTLELLPQAHLFSLKTELPLSSLLSHS